MLFVEYAGLPELIFAVAPAFGVLQFSALLAFGVGSVGPKVGDAGVFYILDQILLGWKVTLAGCA